MLIVHGLALRWRRGLVRQGFMVVWLVFAAVSVGAAAMTWTLTSLLTFRLFPPGSAFFQAALGAGLYPPLAVILTWAHQTLAEPERA
jgi:rod shape-determining protein MreD